MRGIIIVVCIILVYWISTINNNNYEDYLYGFWVADEEFCEDSNVSSYMFFIGESEKNWTNVTRKCYLVITDDIANCLVSINYYQGWGSPLIGKYLINCTVDCEDHVLPEKLVIEIDIKTGKLIMKDNTNIYAILYKQQYVNDLIMTE
jgi:hypothetical protein